MSEQAATAQDRERDSENQEQQAQQTENRGGEQQRYGNRGGRNRNRQGRAPQQHQQQHKSDASLNMNELRDIAELFAQHGLTDFEFENENIRVRLRKELAPNIVQSFAAPQTQSALPQTQASNASAQTIENATPVDEDAGLQKIVSPIVGTFYRSPSPDAAPFVNVGSKVTADTIVCIVEAMKLMNEIPAELSGEIVKMYVENGQPVEYGQPLFAVR